MTATLSHRFSLFRAKESFFTYLHIDMAVIAAAGLLFLAAELANGFKLPALPTLPATEAAIPGDAATATIGATAAKPLPPAMSIALEAAAQRYRVSPDALQPIFAAAQAAARARNLDPLLLIAIIGIESGFNPYAQSPMGAQGLMQVIPRFHQDKLPYDAGKQAFLDPVINVQVGARILQEAIRRQGGLMEGLQYYGGVIDDPDQAYANRVLAEKQRIEQALQRKSAAIRISAN
jgi:soluble lytic murein transglycosylase-like protein